MKSPGSILSLLCLFFAISCATDSNFNTKDLNTTIEINTGKDTYAATDTVTVSFINNSTEDIMLISAGCSAFEGPLPNLRIEKREGVAWKNVTTHGCIAIYQPPITIDSGTSYSIRFRVGILNYPLEEGTYRYQFDLRLINEDRESGEKLPEWNRYSNPFKVE